LFPIFLLLRRQRKVLFSIFFFFLFSLTARKITLLIRFRRNYIHVSAVENGGD